MTPPTTSPPRTLTGPHDPRPGPDPTPTTTSPPRSPDQPPTPPAPTPRTVRCVHPPSPTTRPPGRSPPTPDPPPQPTTPAPRRRPGTPTTPPPPRRTRRTTTDAGTGSRQPPLVRDVGDRNEDAVGHQFVSLLSAWQPSRTLARGQRSPVGGRTKQDRNTPTLARRRPVGSVAIAAHDRDVSIEKARSAVGEQ